MRMFNKKAVKNIAELPAAIDGLDRELKRDEEMSGHKLPDHMKIALLVRLLPGKNERELKTQMGAQPKELRESPRGNSWSGSDRAAGDPRPRRQRHGGGRA